MELRHLRAFRVVAEELNFSRAARALHVAQPALSRTIADLEAEMEVRLLDRNTHGVALTDAGALFLERVRQILAAAKDAVTEAQRRARGETGTLRIGFIGTLSQSLLPRLLRSYRQRYPAVDLVLHELGPTVQRDRILAGELDCGFIGLALDVLDPSLSTLVVAEDTIVVAVPAGHKLAQRPALRLKDLRDEEFFLTAQANAPVFNPWLVSFCVKAGFTPRIARETDRAATVLNYVAAGFGISLFPSRLSVLATPGVKFVPLKSRLPKYRYNFAWPRQSRNRALTGFVDFVREQPREQA